MRATKLCRGLRDNAVSPVLGPAAANVIENLVDALAFYAAEEHYRSTLKNPTTNVYLDKGRVARDVLQSIAASEAEFHLPINGTHN